MKKYGKKYGDVAHLKQSFTIENQKYLEDNMRIAEIYKKQPRRTECKMCGKILTEEAIFFSHGINYYICDCCGHVNGEYLETSSFTTGIYEKGNYGESYRIRGGGYFRRLDSIYIPKVRFMKEVFTKYQIQYEELHYLDVGAGSGYYVGALKKEKLSAIGIEVSSEQVDFGNHMLGEECLFHLDETLIPRRIMNATEEVVSFIGVFEHMINMGEVLEKIANNPHIRYIYFSVPMFSYSVMWEAINDSIFNRQLGGTHTHIFTESSLEYLYKKFGWKILGEWRFGTDAADLLRTVTTKMQCSGNFYLAEIFQDKFNTILDDIQLVMDKSHFCSEIHVLVEK